MIECIVIDVYTQSCRQFSWRTLWPHFAQKSLLSSSCYPTPLGIKLVRVYLTPCPSSLPLTALPGRHQIRLGKQKVISKCLKKWFPSVQKSYLKVFKKFPLSVPKSGPEVFKKVVPKCSKKLPQSVQKSCPKESQKVSPKCSKKCPKKWSQSDQKSDPKVTSLNLQKRPHLAQISLLNTSHYPARRDKDSLFSSTS